MNTSSNLYEHLADELGALIDGRVFAPGDRLPSVRHLSQQKRVSIGTVMQAMRLLEHRGLVDVRPQAGFYVRRRLHPHAIPVPAAAPLLDKPTYVGINNLLMQVLHANEAPGLVQLGPTWPPDALMPVKRLQRIVSSVARRHPALLTRESCVESNEPVFARQVARRALDWGALDPAEVLATHSCTEAISLALRAVAKPGDTIAVEAATYFVLLQMIESLGMKALEIPTHPATGLSIDALELALKENLVQACLFIPNANNPTGCVLSDDAKQRLAALVSQYDVPLIEDDVYGELCFSAERPRPVKAWDRTGNVLLCSSFSKVVGSGTRVGYVAAGKYIERIRFMKTVSGGFSSHFFQRVLAEFIGGSGYDGHVRKMRRVLAQRIARMSDAVADAFPAGCAVHRPQGGLALWVRLPEHVDALELHRRALREGIAFMPGVLFSASGRMTNYLRLNCGNPWDERIDGAVRRLGALIDAFPGDAGHRAPSMPLSLKGLQ
ncbi:MAG: PLP-dependent aminotransferase family protein [Burkholderiaceae bacterium]